MNNPNPSVLSKNKAAQAGAAKEAAAHRNFEPEQAHSGDQEDVSNPSSAKGTVLPRMNSSLVIGVTMICSIVPISFSRTMAMLESISVTSASSKAMTPGT